MGKEETVTGISVPGSFRDPGGFLFTRGTELYRQVNACYRGHYEYLMLSGLYETLVSDGSLISHSVVPEEPCRPGGEALVIKPRRLRMVTYPYEWCFSQLKNAALLTLRIQQRAFESGMVLKDASAYNVQFEGARPVFIDTLSFEKYIPGRPWAAYRQFCRHFLAPLALMGFRDARLGQLMKSHIDGIPLDLAARLLPVACRLRPGLMMHLYMHAAAEERFSRQGMRRRSYHVGARSLCALIDSLETTVRGITWDPGKTVWSEYDGTISYTSGAFDEKQRIVAEFLEAVSPENVWDVGANTGIFSRIASKKGIPTVSSDNDPAVVERNYRAASKEDDRFLVPLLIDIMNLSPDGGWAGEERPAFLKRMKAHTVVFLALAHHAAITHSVSFPMLAGFLAAAATFLVIEFIPRDDPQAQVLAAGKGDAAVMYTREDFERAFGGVFSIMQKRPIQSSGRILYLMKRL